MKRMLARVLAVVLVSSTALVAQGLPPAFDADYTELYASVMRYNWPRHRDFNGGGARAKGMGNAFIGVSDDASAVSWNPAGLYRRNDAYEQPVIALSYQSLSADAQFESNPWGGTPWDEWRQYDYNDAFRGVDFMSLLFPIRIKGHMFVGSLAYTRVGDEVFNSGMGIDVDIPMTFDDFLEDITSPYHYENLASYRSEVNTINIGFGTRLYDKIAFGFAINAYQGRATQFSTETVTWENAVHPFLPPPSQRALAVFQNNVTDTASYSGVFFTLGFKLAIERFSVGLTLKTPHTLKESLDRRLDIRWVVNGIEQAGSVNTIHLDDIVVELDQPWIIGVGFAYQLHQLSENLTVSTDVEYRKYAGGMVNVRDSLRLVPGGTDVEFFTEYDPYWNSSWAIRAGTEYLWETGGRILPVVPLRLGLGYIQVPEPDVTGGALNIDDNSFSLVPLTKRAAMTRWSLGTGVRWEQIHLDLSYARTSIDQADAFWLYRSSNSNGFLNVTFTGYF